MDIDGVLADMDGAKRTQADLSRQNPALVFERTVLWWGELKPFAPMRNPELLQQYLERVKIHVVTRRHPETAAVTTDWLERHYPMLMPRVVAVSCRPEGSKLPDERDHYMWPDVAIDDTFDELADYKWRGVRTIAVHSPRTVAKACIDLGIPVVPDVWSALVMAVVSPNDGLLA